MKIRHSNIFARLSEKEIQDFESKYALTLPTDYRNFLSENNVCTIFPLDFNEVDSDRHIGAIHDKLFGLQCPDEYSIEYYIKTYDGLSRQRLLPLGSDYKDDLICLDLQNSGSVVFYELESETKTTLASSFKQFMDNLYRYERWLDCGIEEKLYCDIEDDLVDEIKKHFNTWLERDFIFDDTDCGLFETAIDLASFEAIKLFHSLEIPVEDLTYKVQRNFYDPNYKGNYEFSETFKLMRDLYPNPALWELDKPISEYYI